jgi:MSHA biogenesis protein MshM
MYLDHFGLDEPPFRITPHTDFFFDGADRGTTLEGLLYAIQYDEGIVKVSGEVGSGKTMLCRVLMERLPENVETIYLANPSFTRDEILRAIADDLKLETSGDSARVLTRDLQAHLIESHARGRRVVILIDEAHAMPEDSLEQVRLLSNLETSRHKLLQIVLFGQPELDQMLAATSLRQLRDRITHSFRMRPLTQEEVSRYVTFRLRAAGYRGPDLFTPKAIALLTRASDGLTRRINILADKALLSAFSLDTHAIDERHVQRAIADSELAPLATAKRPLAYVAAALATGAVLGVLLHWLLGDRLADATASAPSSPPAERARAAPTKPAPPVAAAAPQSPEKAVVARDMQSPPGRRGATSAPPPASVPQAAPAIATPSTPLPNRDSRPPAPKPSAPAASASPLPTKDEVAAAPLMAKVAPQVVPARLLPKQIERIEAYDTRGMRLLGERIAATREALQTTPDEAFSIELYLTRNTDPARIERFLIRARGLATLPGVYVIPLTRSAPTRVWVVYGAFATRAAAEEAVRRLPEVYHKDFGLALRDFAALRGAI